jgi:glycosyltransferase involved in cell wall biosynthesis
MVGGKDADIQTLRNYSDKIGISDHIIFTGHVDTNSLIHLIHLSNLTVSPIPPTPNFIVSSPTKVIESIGLGTPVLANKEIPDQYEIITKSKGGLLVAYKEKAFSEAIVQMMNNKELLKTFAESGKAFIINNRSYKKLSEKVVETYKKMLE